ncbi:hypothetical protein RRF57_009128 [Xylaria bambusicola]|uniref:Uncharacterized protein n=1 Tax=Xylaria bambusicola TaxID=326684 RepID=A0AAN7UT62_9PEZI
MHQGLQHYISKPLSRHVILLLRPGDVGPQIQEQLEQASARAPKSAQCFLPEIDALIESRRMRPRERCLSRKRNPAPRKRFRNQGPWELR